MSIGRLLLVVYLLGAAWTGSRIHGQLSDVVADSKKEQRATAWAVFVAIFGWPVAWLIFAIMNAWTRRLYRRIWRRQRRSR